MNEIDRLIQAHWGGSTRAAQAALRVSKQTISEWRRNGIPELRQYQIAAITGEPNKASRDLPLPEASAGRS